MSDCKRCAELESLLREVWEWSESDDVKGAFISAWVHGIRCTEEEARVVSSMWNRVKQAIGEEDDDHASAGGAES
jgi:hypothetical protein